MIFLYSEIIFQLISRAFICSFLHENLREFKQIGAKSHLLSKVIFI